MIETSPAAMHLLLELIAHCERSTADALERQHVLSCMLVASYVDDFGLDREHCFAKLEMYFDDCERFHCERRHGGRHLDA